MPSLFLIGGYRVFFWSNEAQSTKIWLTRQGGCIVANNSAKIPRRTLDDLCLIISAQHDLICEEWKAFFLVDEIAFYC